MFSSDTPPEHSGHPEKPGTSESPELLQGIRPVPDDGQGPGPGQRQVMLTKEGRRYVFRYPIGQEAGFLKGIRAMASSPGSQINWFDAAVLSHQMGRSMSQDIAELKRA